MSGIYGSTTEDRIRERELDRHLDAQFDDDQKLADILNDLSYERVTDAAYIEAIFDHDPDGMFEAVARMVSKARKTVPGLSIEQQQAHAYRGFADWLT